MVLSNFSNELAEEIKILRDKIDSGYANPSQYKRYHELINLAGIDDNYIHSKLKPYDLNNIEEYQNKRSIIKDDHKVLGIILGLGLAALFLWSISSDKKK